MQNNRTYESLAKIGDLVKVRRCGEDTGLSVGWGCKCFLCSTGSNRVGLIIGPLENNSYEVAFDHGVRQVHNHEFGMVGQR